MSLNKKSRISISKSLLCFCVLLTAVLCDCDNSLKLTYPENPIKFTTYSFYNPDNPDDGYEAFDFQNRTYIPYSSNGSSIMADEAEACLGGIVQEGKDLDDTWVVRLSAFKDNDDFLMIYCPKGGMQPEIFYRAIDSKEKQITLPEYISSDCYEYWK